MANPITHEATDWKPLESGGTEITAARLNNIDGDVTKLANALGAALQVLSAGQDAATVEVPYRPCWLWDPAGGAMTFVAEDGSRTQPLASAADLRSVRDSVSQMYDLPAAPDNLLLISTSSPADASNLASKVVATDAASLTNRPSAWASGTVIAVRRVWVLNGHALVELVEGYPQPRRWLNFYNGGSKKWSGWSQA